jgi:hypothetical protein
VSQVSASDAAHYREQVSPPNLGWLGATFIGQSYTQ